MKVKSVRDSEFPKFLKSEYPDDPAWKGFFKLWLDANGFDYGENDEHIVDGFGDGGIDAIAYPPHGHTELPIVVIQSKYFRSRIPASTLKRFFEAVAAYRSEKKSGFDEWLASVKNTNLRAEYARLWKLRSNIKFILVSEGRLSKESIKIARKLRIAIQDKHNVRALYLDMARGKTPRPQTLKLRVRGPVVPVVKSKEHRLVVFSCPVADFAKAFQEHKKNLFAGNVRYAIRGDTSNGVRLGITRTLKENPEEFAYFHNGITVVCKKLRKHAGSVVLESPSIVNGAQTVSFLGETLARSIPSKATVLVKAIEVTAVRGFEEFETDVAMSSNTQNKVSLSDLSVIDPDLVSLERYFRAAGSFLERKRGDRPLGRTTIKITKDRLLQLFATLDNRVGPAATKDKQQLYRNHSGRLFEYYASSLEKKRDAVFIATLDKFVRDSLLAFKLSGKSGTRKKRRLSLSYFTIFAVIVGILEDLKLWRSARSAFQADGIWGNEYSLPLERDVRKVATSVLAAARQDVDRNETAFFKNREKVKILVLKLRRKCRPRAAVRRLG